MNSIALQLLVELTKLGPQDEEWAADVVSVAADTIWLAARMEMPQRPLRDPRRRRDFNPHGAPWFESPSGAEPAGQTSDPASHDGADKNELASTAPSPLEFYPQGTPGTKPGRVVALPGAPAISGQLRLDQALRALRKRRPDPLRLELDEQATAEQSASAGGFLVPTYRPARTRWLHVVYVIEDSPTMKIWDATAEEVSALLQRAVCPRSYERLWLKWDFGPDATRRIRLVDHADATVRARWPSACSTLVLYLTDAVGAGWIAGDIPKQLSAWTEWAAVAVLQVLPKRLWDYCAYRQRTLGTDCSPLALKAWERGIAGAPGVYSLSVSASSLEAFSGHLSGRPEPIVAQIIGSFQPPSDFVVPEFDPKAKPEGQDFNSDEYWADVYSEFYQYASRSAKRLALHLSAVSVPLTLSVMQLVQRVLVRESAPSELAELFLAGLFVRDRSIDIPGDPVYAFGGNLRERLEHDAGSERRIATRVLIMEYLDGLHGRPRTFIGAVASRAGEKVDAAVPEAGQGLLATRETASKLPSAASKLEVEMPDEPAGPASSTFGSQLFISHSSKNNAEALALSEWLTTEGWHDHYLDIDPQRGASAGVRWELALHRAAARCDAVLFIVSPNWLRSDWCRREFTIAQQLGKRLFVLLLDGAKRADVEASMKEIWQLVDLSSGDDYVVRELTLPNETKSRHVYFSRSALSHLRRGLLKAGLDPQGFPWPPSDEPDRAPYRGLAPLEAKDAGIFFGREGLIIELLSQLRSLRHAAPPRFLAILGASGAGKSSFLRAGILPRLERDDRHFLPLPVIRPERAVLSGSNGLVECLWTMRRIRKLNWSRRQIEEAVATGAPALRILLQELARHCQVPEWDSSQPQPPSLVLAIDQAEELFQAEGAEQAGRFLSLLAELLADTPKLIVLCTIRSDSYEPLQSAPALADITQRVFFLPPMPHGAFRQVIEAPVALLKHSPRPLRIEPQLTEALLRDIAEGGAKDALPLLAFTLERLYVDYSADGLLSLKDYQDLGRIAGAIEKAVTAALEHAQRNPTLPSDRGECLKLLRRGLIPWMAGINPRSNLPYRKVALFSQLPEEARELIEHFVEHRLLAKDINHDGEVTVEIAHESMLRQWTRLRSWLEEDAVALTVLQYLKDASKDWDANKRNSDWLTHVGGRLEDAEALSLRPELASILHLTDRAYLSACRVLENGRRDRELRQAQELMGIGRHSVRHARGPADALVFICHASEDRNIALQFVSLLAESGIKSFIDADDFRADASFVERISGAIAECTHFVAIISPASSRKKLPRDEITAITPRVVDQTVSFLPFGLHGYDYADFRRDFVFLGNIPLLTLDAGLTPEIGRQLVKEIKGLDVEAYFTRQSERLPKDAVFISHAKEDRATVAELGTALERAGVPVWVDKCRLEQGENYERGLRVAVMDCSFFISLISPRTEVDEERYFHKERRWAEDRFTEGAVFYLPLLVDMPAGAQVRREPAVFHKIECERYSAAMLPGFVAMVKAYWDEFRHGQRPTYGLAARDQNRKMPQ